MSLIKRIWFCIHGDKLGCRESVESSKRNVVIYVTATYVTGIVKNRICG